MDVSLLRGGTSISVTEIIRSCLSISDVLVVVVDCSHELPIDHVDCSGPISHLY